MKQCRIEIKEEIEHVVSTQKNALNNKRMKKATGKPVAQNDHILMVCHTSAILCKYRHIPKQGGCLLHTSRKLRIHDALIISARSSRKRIYCLRHTA